MMGIPLSPGIALILSALPSLLLPPFVLCLCSFLVPYFQSDIAIPTLAYVLSLPAYLVLNGIWGAWKRRREMERLGAQDMPLWVGKWPLHVDLLGKMYDSWANGYVADALDEPTERLGMTFVTRFLGIDAIITSDPIALKTMLTISPATYEKGSTMIDALGSLLGSGIFNSDGDAWKYHRRLTKPYFHKSRTSDFDLYRRYADKAVGLVKDRLREGMAVDLQDVMERYTLDAATEFLCGSCVDALSAPLPYPPSSSAPSRQHEHPADTFARAFAGVAHKVRSRLWKGPAWPLLELTSDATNPEMKVIDAFLGPIIRGALETKQAKGRGPGEGGEEQDTLLHSLLEETKDFKVLKDELVNVLIAGRDTTASLLTFILYALSQHPEALAKLRAEIGEKLGSERPPTFEDLKGMKYTRAVIDETLRLFPPVPFNARETTEATTWPSNVPGEKPYYLPAKTPINFSVWLMHRNKDLWGPDALEFDPDRFIDERLHKYYLANPFIFLPFNAGPRLCIGLQFAYNEASFMLIRLFQAFDSITLDSTAQPAYSHPPPEWKRAEGSRKAKETIWPKTHLTLYSNGGLWARMNEAQESQDI